MMSDCMTFPDTVEEFMEQYKIVDTDGIYMSKGAELVPIFRMRQWFEHLPSAQQETEKRTAETAQNVPNGDLISRKMAIDAFEAYKKCIKAVLGDENELIKNVITCRNIIDELPPAQPDLGKYEYHYDHTDCIWYRPEARNRCPSTCAQYRDGWNDAMNYIFRDGKGYRPYRRDRRYEDGDTD